MTSQHDHITCDIAIIDRALQYFQGGQRWTTTHLYTGKSACLIGGLGIGHNQDLEWAAQMNPMNPTIQAWYALPDSLRDAIRAHIYAQCPTCRDAHALPSWHNDSHVEGYADIQTILLAVKGNLVAQLDALTPVREEVLV